MLPDTRFYENGNVTTIIDYRFVGYGINAQEIFQKIITTFTILGGVIKFKEPQTVKCFYR